MYCQFKLKIKLIFHVIFITLIYFTNIFASGRAVKIKELIIRTPSLEPCYWAGPGTYYDHVDEIVHNATNLKIEILSILVRTVDDNFDRGAMMYSSTLPNTHSYNCGSGQWNDSKLQYLINKAHSAGLKVYAWFPVFNDADLWDAYPEYRLQPVNYSELPTGKFCSPANTNVRNRELACINEFMNTKGFGFDGIRLDYLRYQSEDQDQSTYAANEYMSLYGKNITNVINNGWNNYSDYTQYLNWRARKLVTFVTQVKSIVGPNKKIGCYLMPHSGVDPSGYYYEPWSGVDYELFETLKVDVIPILYWNDFSVHGYTKFGWVNGSMANTQDFIQPGSVYLPCFSLVYPENEWQTAIDYMKQNNLCDIVVFHWGGGGYLQTLFNKMKNILNTANGDYSYGHIISPNNKTIISNVYPFEFHCQDVPDWNYTISTCAYRIDNEPFTNFPVAVDTNMSTTGIIYKKFINPFNLSSGNHIMVLRTVNNHNSVSTDFIHFGVKNLNDPQVVIETPIFNQTVSGVTAITANVSLWSNRTISMARYYIDNTFYSNDMAVIGSSPQFTVWSNWDTTIVGDGYHTIKVKVVDNSNHIGESYVDVFVDNITESTYYVKPAARGGNDGNLGTSWAQAWATIQHAVNNTGPGDVIFVSNGIYSENLNITSGGSNGLYKSILAYDGQPKIDGREAGICVTFDNVKYVKIKGFYILSGNPSGAYVYHSTNIEILDCEFSDNNNGTGPTRWGYDIDLRNSKFVKISNCNIYSIGWESAASNTPMWGINIDTSISNIIINNNIHNNTGDGIAEVYGKGNIFKYNIIRANRWLGVTVQNSKYNTYYSNKILLNNYRGFKLQNCTNFSVLYNNFTNNNWVGAQTSGGLYAIKSFNIDIKHNIFSDNARTPLMLENSRNIYVTSNDISAQWAGNYSCIDVSYITNSVIRDNYLRYSIANGLAMINSVSNIIEGNTSYSNGEYGIKFVARCNNNTIKNNKMFKNAWSGLCINYSARNKIFNNRFIGNGSYSVEIVGCTNLEILGNYASSNYGGIFIESGGGTNVISGNNIKKSMGYKGIVILNSSAVNLIKANNIISNYVTGIYITNSKNTIIETNKIIYNGSADNHAGVTMKRSRNIKLRNNQIISNMEYNVYLVNATNNVVIDNIIRDARNATGTNAGVRIENSSISNFVSQNYIRNNNIGVAIINSMVNYVEKNVIRENEYGIWLNNGDGINIYNNTIYKNTSDGIYINNTSINPLPDIKNVITSSNNYGINNQSGQVLTVNYSCYDDSWLNVTLGMGCTNANPRFKNTSIISEDFHLKYNSPALEKGYPNLVPGTMGAFTVTVTPEYSKPGAYTKHKISFTTLYGNKGIPPNARIEIIYPSGAGFGFIYATNCTSSSFWGGGSPVFSIVPFGNQLEILRIGGKTTFPGMVEDLIISTVINPTNISTNYKVLLMIYDTNNNLIYKEWSNDFIIGPSYPFKVTATTPANYSRDFSYSFSNIYVIFNNDVEPNTVTANSLLLTDSTNNSFYALSVVNISSNKCEFDIPDLIPNEFYRATIFTNIKDIYGQKMLSKYNWYFTSGPGWEIPHYYDGITLDGNLGDWIITNVIKMDGVKNVVIARDATDTGVYATTNIWVTWDSNNIYFAIVKNNNGSREDDWYDYIAIDVTRDNWGATSFSDSYTSINFTNQWRYPEFIIRFSHDGSDAGVRNYWWGWSSYKWNGSTWVTGPSVQWQGTGANESQRLEFSINVRALTNIFMPDTIPNRIAILHWVDDNLNGQNLLDFCPEPGMKWVTFDIDNNGDDIPDGSSSPYTYLIINKFVSNIKLANSNYNVIPGATITYGIKYSNTGNSYANSIIIYDRISQFITFSTSYVDGSTSGWVVEYSTNTNPNQGWFSSDYLPTFLNKADLKWIRWRKNIIPIRESGIIYFKVTVK